MGSNTARFYTVAATILVFFVLWSTIAAKPWASVKPAQDPRVLVLTKRERALQRQALEVKRIVSHRWVVYERRLQVRRQAIAAAEQQHAQAIAAARAAYRAWAASAASRATVHTIASVSRTSATPTLAAQPSGAAHAAAAPAAPPAPAPPPVQIVTLPPVTATHTS